MINLKVTRWGFCILSLLLLGIASRVPELNGAESPRVIAEVNGENIDERDLGDRIRRVHRFKRGVRPDGGAGSVNISEMVEDLVNEKLMVQEAFRLGLHETDEFKQRLKAFVAPQSVLELRTEVVYDLIDVSEDEIRKYYDLNYEKDGDSEKGLSKGLAKRIEKELRKKKEKKLSDDFVDMLKEKARIEVDWDYIRQLGPDTDNSAKKEEIGRVNGVPLLRREFLADLKKGVPNWKGETAELKRKIVDRLITYELVEQEALERDYMEQPDFARRVEKRKAELLVNAFKAQMVYPLAVPDKEELKAYYDGHLDDFRRGGEVHIRQMSFQSQEEAEKIVEELRQGADFEFLSTWLDGGSVQRPSRVWRKHEELSPPVRRAVKGLKVGQISGVIPNGGKFKILKLKGKRGGDVAAFSQVIGRVEELVAQRKFDRVLQRYLKRLREKSEIRIDRGALKDIEQDYWNGTSEESNS